ncbi:MAG: cytidylate kinase-like family protein [candidate division Zixibacteria bacterium]|nr:cytidylate kinase-like family protein [candidate division Zixibacteria bacterium]
MTSIEAIINRQFLLWEQLKSEPRKEEVPTTLPPQIITVSRQTGSRGSYFASKLAHKLDCQRIHREIIDAICSSSGYRKRIIESLDERYRTVLDTLVTALLTGQAVDHGDYYRHLCQVVLSMAELGGIVLVGRGGGFILGPRRGFHIRVVCPRQERIDNLVSYKNVSATEAEESVERSDAQRREYISKLFGANIDDPSWYDLVFNTAYLDVEEMVGVAIKAFDGKMNKLARLEREGR